MIIGLRSNDKNIEWLQVFYFNAFGQAKTSSVFFYEETGLGSLPAIMYPEPVFG